MSRTIEVHCTIDIEQSFDSLHAHAIPEGIELRPGDSVVVHGAPDQIGYGESVSFTARATVTRAGWLERQLTPIFALAELGDLFNVGFEPDHAIVLRTRGAAA